MRKSYKCSYKIGINEKKKVKFLRPELAIAEAERLNNMPNAIKKYVPYKCTTCYFFHVGRSIDSLEVKKNGVFVQEGDRVADPVQEVVVVAAVEKKKPVEVIKKVEILYGPDHDDFDWDKDKRLI